MATLCAEWTCPSLDKDDSCPTGHDHRHSLRLQRPLPSLAPTALVPSCVSRRSQALMALAAVDELRVVRGRRSPRDAGEAFTIELFTSSARSERRIPLATSSRLPHVHSPTHAHTHAHAQAQGQSLAPSSPVQCRESATRRPALAVGKRLSQFADLRNALYLTVLEAHVRQPFCPYCRELINYSIWGNRLPTGLGARLLLRRDREEARLLALLESFTAELLARTLRTGRPDAPPSSPLGAAGLCSAQSEIPVLVYDFLFGQQRQ